MARTWFQRVDRGQGEFRLLALMARPEIIPTEPLATWQPGLSKPDFGAVARTAS